MKAIKGAITNQKLKSTLRQEAAFNNLDVPRNQYTQDWTKDYRKNSLKIRYKTYKITCTSFFLLSMQSMPIFGYIKMVLQSPDVLYFLVCGNKSANTTAP